MAIGITKQGYAQHVKRRATEEDRLQALIPLMDQVRAEQADIGIRKAYFQLQYDDSYMEVGRDRFEHFMQSEGYLLAPKPIFKPHLTKVGDRYFPNIVASYQVDNINQVWFSDTTYWDLCGQWVYLTTVMDAYSRRLLALVCSQDLVAESTSIAAVESAISVRDGMDLSACILHTDRGGQYIDNGLLKVLAKYEIQSSMATSVYENVHVERLNETIKSLMRHWQIQDYPTLSVSANRFEKIYNERRLHNGLLPLRQTPNGFEALIATMTDEQRPVLTLPPIANRY